MRKHSNLAKKISIAVACMILITGVTINIVSASYDEEDLYDMEYTQSEEISDADTPDDSWDSENDLDLNDGSEYGRDSCACDDVSCVCDGLPCDCVNGGGTETGESDEADGRGETDDSSESEETNPEESEEELEEEYPEEESEEEGLEEEPEDELEEINEEVAQNVTNPAAPVQIEIDSDGNVTIDPSDISYNIMLDGYVFHIILPMELDEEDIGLTMPKEWTYQVSHTNVESFLMGDYWESDEWSASAAESETHTLITITHTWLDGSEDGYVGITPLISNAPSGHTLHDVPVNASNAEWTTALGTTGNRVLSIQGNHTTMPTIRISGTRRIIIASNGTNLSNHNRSGTPFRLEHWGNGRNFVVNSGITLTLSQITVTGANPPGTVRRGGIEINGGTLIMQNGSTITDSSANQGGGVWVGNRGNVTLNAGSAITNNRANIGAGMWGEGGATITMNNGRIDNNTAANHGGSVQINDSTTSFTMHNGFMRNNTAGDRGGAVRAITGSTFTMRGGTISNNTVNGASGSQGGGGVYANSTSVFNMHGGTIENNRAHRGGGVSMTSGGTFNMHGGTIRNNRNLPGNSNPIVEGGGVWLGGTPEVAGRPGSSLRMTDGGTIENNRAVRGGGVWARDQSTITMDSPNARITGNESTTNGGGIFVASNAGINVQRGTISGNRAPNGDGGGIFTEDKTYRNITTTAAVMFSNNSAVESQMFVERASDFPNIAWGSLSISIGRTPHALNNYDINYNPPAVISLMRAPNDLLFHQPGSSTVILSNNPGKIATTIRGWFGSASGYTNDIVVMDTTGGNFNWRLSLTNTQELTHGTHVLENVLVYRNGSAVLPFGLGDTVQILNQADVSGGYAMLDWSDTVGIFVDDSLSAHMASVALEVEYQAEFLWVLVHDMP